MLKVTKPLILLSAVLLIASCSWGDTDVSKTKTPKTTTITAPNVTTKGPQEKKVVTPKENKTPESNTAGTNTGNVAPTTTEVKNWDTTIDISKVKSDTHIEWSDAILEDTEGLMIEPEKNKDITIIK